MNPGTNNVEVDDVKIAAELKGAAAGAPQEGEFIPKGEGAPGAAPGPQPEETVELVDWTEAAAGLVWIFDKVVAPNWALDIDEKNALAEGGGRVLKAFFPATVIDPRIAAISAFITVCGLVTMRRIDPETGSMRPMRAPDPEAEPETGAAPLSNGDRAPA